MDIFAHFLWSFALFSKRKDRWIAGLCGVLPDLLSFGPYFLWEINTHVLGKPDLNAIPGYVHAMYNLTHSFIPVLLVMLTIFLMTKKFYAPLLAWVLHIIIDIPTHTEKFFPTPFLWPFPTPYFSGINWGNKYFMIINYTALILVYVFYVIPNLKKLKKVKTKN